MNDLPESNLSNMTTASTIAMKRRARLPTLTALRAFHVVFQCLSLRKAGEELAVTPQAVGQQIKLLEETLKVALFVQKGRSLQPTESAVLLATFVKSGFDEFAEGVRRVTKSEHRSYVALNASPYFATHFLVPTLLVLREATPGTEIRLTTSVLLPDFDQDEVDMAIQWGYGNWNGYEWTHLVSDPKVICCTPAIARSVSRPSDLTRVDLLNSITAKRLWSDIFRHLGVDESPPLYKIGFDDSATMRRATLQGIGVGLLSEIHAEEDIRSGALVAPLGRDVLCDMPLSDIPGFYLVAPRSKLRVAAVGTFYRWLFDKDWGVARRRELEKART